jgi:hypothetical protein
MGKSSAKWQALNFQGVLQHAVFRRQATLTACCNGSMFEVRRSPQWISDVRRHDEPRIETGQF